MSRCFALALLAVFVWGCGSSDDASNAPSTTSLDEQLTRLIRAEGLKRSPTRDEPPFSEAQLAIREQRRELGRQLFFDHALGGVQQTSCGTCHHATFQFSDARNIARGVFCDLMGEDRVICRDAPTPGTQGNVVGPERASPLNSRNTPSLINIALFPRQMWNGRFHFVDEGSTDVNKCDPLLGFELPPPERVMQVRSLPTAQAHIPVTEVVEMTGDFPHPGEPLEESEHRNPEVRDALAARVSALPAYRPLFEAAYPSDRPNLRLFEGDPEIAPGAPIPYLAIADAMGHFQESLIMTDAPWDRYVRGDRSALSDQAKQGAVIFYTERRCSSCHSGDLFSDFDNYNIGVPQVGPGTAQKDLSDPRYFGLLTWDFGLEEITNRRVDRFKFRTPPLRGVALTSPYMHNGAYTTLEDAIRHHTDPRSAYENYDISQIELDMQLADGLKPIEAVFEDVRNPVVLGHESGQTRIDLSDQDIADLIAFLKALTDPRMLDTARLAPKTVPSGLPVDVPGPATFPVYQ